MSQQTGSTNRAEINENDQRHDETFGIEDSAMMEEEEEVKRIAPWTQQLTIRGIVTSVAIGIIYSMIVMKLGLTTGLIPNLNVSAALLAFVLVKTWTKLLGKVGVVSKPFTRQENALIQTCGTACYSIAVAGGFGSYLLGLNRKTYEQAGVDSQGNHPASVKEPGVGWMTSFLFISSFVGLLALLPLRKIMIIDYKLPYPTGTATAVLINGFHTSKGNKMAKKQVQGFMRFSCMSFIWAFFQWFYSGGDTCGFVQFPTFGLAAWKNSFYFDFSMTYVGAGMICSHLVNLSLLLGAVLSWGIMWPLISDRKGDWYSPSLPASSMKSLNGYKVFIYIALILGDGLYQFLKIIYFTSINILAGRRARKNIRPAPDSQNQDPVDVDLRRNEIFMRENIPIWVACVGYVALSIVSVIVIPLMFHELKWYYVVVAYILAPALSFCSAYGGGLTDMNMGYNYGKVALPQHCLQLCYGFFGFAVVANLSKDLLPKKLGEWIPLPMAMAVPFLVGGYFAIDMCVGSLVVFVWHKLNGRKASLMVPAVASGLICGDGLWILPSSLLALAKVKPPICMGFSKNS